jgi:hypothetical protein
MIPIRQKDNKKNDFFSRSFIFSYGAIDGSRTRDPTLTMGVLYLPELQRQNLKKTSLIPRLVFLYFQITQQ